MKIERGQTEQWLRPPSPDEKLTLQPYKPPVDPVYPVLNVFLGASCIALGILSLVLFDELSNGCSNPLLWSLLSAMCIVAAVVGTVVAAHEYLTNVLVDTPRGWAVYYRGEAHTKAVVTLADEYHDGQVAMFTTMPVNRQFTFKALTRDFYSVEIPIDFQLQATDVALLGRSGLNFEEALAATFQGPIARKCERVDYADLCRPGYLETLLDQGLLYRAQAFTRQYGVKLLHAHVHNPIAQYKRVNRKKEQ